jgi:hypothetical protein
MARSKKSKTVTVFNRVTTPLGGAGTVADVEDAPRVQRLAERGHIAILGTTVPASKDTQDDGTDENASDGAESSDADNVDSSTQTDSSES